MPDQHWLLIKELTHTGRVFRPSDWAQRLATAVATPGPDRRVLFHPRVHTAVLEGINCVVVDTRLQGEDPRLYEFLVKFAESNNLQMESRSQAPIG